MNIRIIANQPPTNDDQADQGTAPVPAGPYYKTDYFELEREAVFRPNWLHVGHICELPEPGNFIVRPVEVLNASLLITRTKDGELRAFHNVCTHRGTQLVSEPSGKRSSFTCPYHAWNFGNDGQLRSAPDFERFYVDKSQCSLPEVAVEVCAGLIFVNFDKNRTQSLRESLGVLAEQMETLAVAKATTFSEYIYEIDANWKLTYDNFQENYHLRFIHPRSGADAAGPQNPFGYPTHYGFHDPHRTQTIWANPEPNPSPTMMLGFGKLYEAAVRQGFLSSPHTKDYFALFPNFFMFGAPTTHFSHTVMPISAQKSRGVIRLYWIGSDSSASERFAREFSMTTALDIHSEDRAVIEAGQRGLNSGALEHIHFQSQEVLCRHFFNQVDSRVQAYIAKHNITGGAL